MRIIVLILSLLLAQPSFAITMNGKVEVDGVLQDFSFDSKGGAGPVEGKFGDNPCIVILMDTFESGWSAHCYVDERAVVIDIVPMYFADADVYRVLAAPDQDCSGDDVLLHVSYSNEPIPPQSFRCQAMDMGL